MAQGFDARKPEKKSCRNLQFAAWMRGNDWKRGGFAVGKKLLKKGIDMVDAACYDAGHDERRKQHERE